MIDAAFLAAWLERRRLGQTSSSASRAAVEVVEGLCSFSFGVKRMRENMALKDRDVVHVAKRGNKERFGEYNTVLSAAEG